MRDDIERQLDRVGGLTGGLRGVEKESLRVSPDGRIATTPHPESLGAPLTHPSITTDFSEAMLELVTPPLTDSGAVQEHLYDLHRFVVDRIGDELLWAPSMPCLVASEDAIPLARFGTSHSGRLREVYRIGLSHRYGRAMEIISGVHFNFSVPETYWVATGASGRGARDAGYFGLMRNYRRWGWLLLYLFGASPAVCRSFFHGRDTSLPELLPGTYYGQHATTLRMSDIGYRSVRQAGWAPSMNCLDSYLETLACAVRTPEPAYERIGVEVGGEWRQLSANVLQIENEFYGFIRPKQPAAFGERPIRALRERGVGYLEVRALDVDPFSPVGIDIDTMRFVEAFLWLCLLADSPPMSDADLSCCDADHTAVAREGRRPGLVLEGGRRLDAWARELLSALEPVCAALDDSSRGYNAALERQYARLHDPEQTPSARLLALIRARGTSFFAVALELSQRHRKQLREHHLPADRHAQLVETAARSQVERRALERSQSGSFEEYVQQYLADR